MASNADVTTILARCSLARGLTPAELAKLASSAAVRVRDYERGEVVFHEGEQPHSIYILLSGEVHILKDTFSGRQIFISEIASPGDMFGEIYEVLGEPYDMYVEAAAPTRLLEIASSYITLEPSAGASPVAQKVQNNLMRIFARKAYFMHNKIKVLASGTLREKIVRYLFYELGSNDAIELTVSREFLAAYLAVTRPSLSRELSSMQRDGILAVDGKKIRVVDMEKFEEYL